MRRGDFVRAFSLIEVVLALAVMTFALVAVVGLFSVGLRTNKESSDQLQATDIASLLIASRRAQPTGVLTNFALPPLNVALTSNSVPVNLALDGTIAPTAAAAPFKLNYIVGTSDNPKVANVYLLLWWPGSAAKPPTNSPGGYYQLATQIALP
jgi:type II secretory pathway pseudopilin PulG